MGKKQEAPLFFFLSPQIAVADVTGHLALNTQGQYAFRGTAHQSFILFLNFQKGNDCWFCDTPPWNYAWF